MRRPKGLELMTPGASLNQNRLSCRMCGPTRGPGCGQGRTAGVTLTDSQRSPVRLGLDCPMDGSPTRLPSVDPFSPGPAPSMLPGVTSPVPHLPPNPCLPLALKGSPTSLVPVPISAQATQREERQGGHTPRFQHEPPGGRPEPPLPASLCLCLTQNRPGLLSVSAWCPARPGWGRPPTCRLNEGRQPELSCTADHGLTGERASRSKAHLRGSALGCESRRLPFPAV